MKKHLLFVVSASVAAVFSLAVSQASGAALVTYDFEGYTTSADTGAPSGATAAGVTATNLVPNAGAVTPANGFLGRGTTGNANNYFFASTSAPISPSNGAGRSVGTQSQYTYDTFANAVTNNTYYSFTVTPGAGGMLSFSVSDTLTFALQVRSLNASGTVPYTVQFGLRTSVDNYATDVGTSVALGVTAVNTNISANESINLSSLGMLAANQTVTFRLYPFDNQQATSNDDYKFDNVVVNGTISGVTGIPEPSTYALLGLGALGIFFVRRRAVCRV